MTDLEARDLINKATKKSKFEQYTGFIYDLEYRLEIGEKVDEELISAKRILGYK